MTNFFIKSEDEDKNQDARKILWNSLQTSENYLYLIWAWCSVNSWWKIMSTLWNEFKSEIPWFDDLKNKTWYSWENLEELLTKIKTTENYFKNLWTSKDSERIEMETFRKEIENRLKKHCKEDIILNENSAHIDLITKVTNWRKLSLPRTKIFSLNYDTLFEQTWNRWQYTIIDWFSFSIPRTFNWTNFDLDIVKRNKNYLEKEDNFEKKVFHLYKLHGSVNWEDESWRIIQSQEAKWKLIYPWSSKYEESYEMPYFEMISRFQQELRKENVTLNIIWYSFSDNHINSMIIEAFKTNPSLRLIIVWTTLFQKKYEEWDDEKEWFLKKINKWEEEISCFNKIMLDSVKILNEWLKMDRVFLFDMYFEPFVELLPLKEIKTREEIMIEALNKFSNPTT